MSDPTSPAQSGPRLSLRPPPYQQEILEYLRTQETELWDWFRSSGTASDRSEAVRLDLLKSTYRIEPGDDESLYELVKEVVDALGIGCSCTLYRAQNSQGLNVSIASIPGEAHIVFHGPVQKLLTRDELRAVLAHELTHFLVYEGWNGDLAMTEQILAAMASDSAAEACHFESLRLFHLYTEILADRGSVEVTGDPLITISGLLKIETGDEDVNAASYMKQALEIFGKETSRAEGSSHPEAFIRAYALHRWAESNDAAEEEVRRLIEGPLCLNRLDLLTQGRVRALTRRLIERFLDPVWMQTEPLIGHARLFFDDYAPGAEANWDESLPKDLATEDPQLRDYFCYVLLDFVAIDRELEEAPLAAALQLSADIGFEDRFMELVRKELKLTKKVVETVGRNAEEILRQAGESE